MAAPQRLSHGLVSSFDLEVIGVSKQVLEGTGRLWKVVNKRRFDERLDVVFKPYSVHKERWFL